MLVIDASALTELVLERPAARRIAGHLADHGYELHAPHLVDVEVLSALRNVVASGDASTDRAREAMDDLLDLTIERYPHEPLLPRAWALTDNFSSYDATYVALAELLTDGGAPLLTADSRLGRAARTHTNLEVLLAA
jgi:predicted nucleic acid-binding protein